MDSNVIKANDLKFFDKQLRHKQLCEELNKTYVAKNHDYGDSFGKTFSAWGIASAGVRISDKYNRFVNLCNNAESMVQDESVLDTLLDMANYCLMTYMEIERTNAGFNK